MARLYVVLLVLAFLPSCASINEASRRYFYGQDDLAGVESPQKVFERINGDAKMRRLLYANLKASHIIECTFLRNQFYVAAKGGVSGQVGQEIKKAAIILEDGFQNSDQDFLSACDQVMASPIGQIFIKAQREFTKAEQ